MLAAGIAFASARAVHPFAATTAAIGRALAYASRHTGVPVVVVAAIALVVSARVVRRTVRFAIEVAVVTALLVVAARLGWIRF